MKDSPAATALDGGDDVGDGAVFEHIAFRAEVERGLKQLFFAMDGQENDLDLKLLLADGARDCEAVLFRHVNVEHGHCRLMLDNQGERGFAIAGFGDNLQGGVGFDGLA